MSAFEIIGVVGVLAFGLFAGGWLHRVWPWTNLIKKPKGAA